MEDSGEVHSEENVVNAEKNPKRKLKTPAQVAALENFYKEYKYPSDKLRLQLAEEIGLTEKQVSGWFCHRRLKDKRLLKGEAYANGRQDHSSVIQDRASGLRQDSCDSAKQGGYRYADPREVESQSIYGHDQLAYGRRSYYTENVNAQDNTSSESSSFLQDRFLSGKEDPYDMETSRYLTQDHLLMPVHAKGKNMGYKPAGYLKVKGAGAVEHAAITAVKRQLGGNYREDGPLLGVEFESLPPGAFESPVRHPVDDSFYPGDSKLHHSPAFSRGRKQSSHVTKYEVHNSKIRYQDSDKEGENGDNYYGSDYEDMRSHSQPKRRSPFLNYSNHFPSQNSPMDIYEDSAGEAALYDIKRKNRMNSKHSIEAMIPDPGSKHDNCYGGKVTSEEMKPWLHDLDNSEAKAIQNGEFFSRSSNMIFGQNKSIPAEQKRPSKKLAKGLKHHGEKKSVKDNLEPLRVSKHYDIEYLQHDYTAKAIYSEAPIQTNRIKRSAMEVPSSFSEDETAETSSSSE